jgi:hypothetical protein
MVLPHPSDGLTPVHPPADWYYRIPVQTIYRSYPVYAPGKEPPGYFDRLRQAEPQVAFNAATLKTDADWVKAGRVVFEAPHGLDTFFESFLKPADVRDPVFFRKYRIPLAKDGTVPFFQYVVQKKGKVQVGVFSCAMCHSRVMPDGSVVNGAQGNLPFEAIAGGMIRRFLADGALKIADLREDNRLSYRLPWLNPDPVDRYDSLSGEERCAAEESIPPGVIARHNSGLLSPVHVPDLIGIKDHRYLDSTGLEQHRSIGDLMRYAALNQSLDFAVAYHGFIPVAREPGKLPEPEAFMRLVGPNYDDAQLYALARYLYSLKPPANPHRFDAIVARGQQVFAQAGCGSCHTPPLYTNNCLTPVDGFTIPAEHRRKYRILPVSVGTDPELALRTRRGTGYYKVPSLRGVWYRSMFGHDGSCATLEDWFDPRRIRDDYVPTGFRGYGVRTRAVKGHPYGLALSAMDQKALIAFLKTL